MPVLRVDYRVDDTVAFYLPHMVIHITSFYHPVWMTKIYHFGPLEHHDESINNKTPIKSKWQKFSLILKVVWSNHLNLKLGAIHTFSAQLYNPHKSVIIAYEFFIYKPCQTSKTFIV